MVKDLYSYLSISATQVNVLKKKKLDFIRSTFTVLPPWGSSAQKKKP